MRLDVSHHFGPLTCFFIELGDNRKLILMGPGAKHPEHWHPKRTEKYKLLWGDAEFIPGLVIKPRTRHSFSTVNGCVIEESGNMPDIAIYTDDEINATPREQRKTYIDL